MKNRTKAAIAALAIALGNGCNSANVPATPLQHIVIIVQENRTPDNLFQGLPGADIATKGLNSQNQWVTLHSVNLADGYDISHAHGAFKKQYNGGKMNGFDAKLSKECSTNICAYGYVPNADVAPYFAMAEQYVFADKMFSTQQGPSFPAHQYIVSGTSSITASPWPLAAENPNGAMIGGQGGCDSAPTTTVANIAQDGTEAQKTFPCYERPALTDLIDAKGLSWRYYQASGGPGLWNGLDAVKHVWQSPEYKTNVIYPSTNVLNDIASGHLASVTWITPRSTSSDHAHTNDGSGPSWVANIVNAIGTSPFWSTTAIVITWDDWGGWYDHVKPPVRNAYELGFRVPLIVISPYAKAGYVSHTQHEFGSILHFAETTFGLGSLNTTDALSDDLSDCFDFTRAPRPFATFAPGPVPFDPAKVDLREVDD